MPRPRVFNLYWLLVLLWMALIFSASTDAGSTRRTSRFLAPLLRWLKPDISREAIGRVQLVVRKLGHLGEYAILALLFWRAWRRSTGPSALSWSWASARFTLLFCVAYAASDELHQHFVSSRQASLVDVGIDSLGVGLGLGLIWIICRQYGERLPILDQPA